MTHITTADTARRLKQAGFPQPEFEFGQMWYIGNALHMYQNGIDHGDIGISCEMLKMDANNLVVRVFSSTANINYAPTATEIMQDITEYPVELRYSKKLKGFYIELIESFDPNPAECAAAMWLHLKKAKYDGCSTCKNNKPGLEAGYFCATNCIAGSRYEDKKQPEL